MVARPQNQAVLVTTAISSRATLDLVSSELAADITAAVSALREIRHRAMTPAQTEPFFQQAVLGAIESVERRGDILRKFLHLGPYEGDDEIPPELAAERCSDAECDRAITLLYSHSVNAFKGQLAELLSMRPLVELVRSLTESGLLGPDTTLYAGDAAMPISSRGFAKGADFHLLQHDGASTSVQGVVEVKSFVSTPAKLDRQLASHISRAHRGLRLRDERGGCVDTVPVASRDESLRISVSLAAWRLPRGYHLSDKEGRSFLHTEPLPPIPSDTITKLGDRRWHIELGWSQEALCAEAYQLTYWYMEQLGVDLFTENGSPWPEMTPQQAGANAATQALYYAIRRCTTRTSEQRAISLYNAYGFGYALGSSYKDSTGRRQMLWPEDLREMLENGADRRECRIRF